MGLRLVRSQKGRIYDLWKGVHKYKGLRGRFPDYLLIHLLMLPTSKRLKGHIALGLSVLLSEKKIKLGFLNFIDGFLIKK